MLQQESIRMFIQMREIQVQRRNSRGTWTQGPCLYLWPLWCIWCSLNTPGQSVRAQKVLVMWLPEDGLCLCECHRFPYTSRKEAAILSASDQKSKGSCPWKDSQ
jgi:hypothetical protein